jgi:hypothetical protein
MDIVGGTVSLILWILYIYCIDIVCGKRNIVFLFSEFFMILYRFCNFQLIIKT